MAQPKYTEDALYAQKRLAAAKKNPGRFNKKSLARLEEEFLERSKQKVKVKSNANAKMKILLGLAHRANPKNAAERRRARSSGIQVLPKYEFTSEAMEAQKRIDLAKRYSNKENLAKVEAEFGEAAKEKVRIKYKLDPKTGRYVRADIK